MKKRTYQHKEVKEGVGRLKIEFGAGQRTSLLILRIGLLPVQRLRLSLSSRRTSGISKDFLGFSGSYLPGTWMCYKASSASSILPQLLHPSLPCLLQQIPTLRLRDHHLTHTHPPLGATLCLATKLSPLLHTSQIIVSARLLPLLNCVNFVSILQDIFRGRIYYLEDTSYSRWPFLRVHQSQFCASSSHRQSNKTQNCESRGHQLEWPN